MFVPLFFGLVAFISQLKMSAHVSGAGGSFLALLQVCEQLLLLGFQGLLVPGLSGRLP